ncbi:substrate-binding periplasmic protein [Roseateles saccharophilus]|uniref:Amino acid ABC transporter substrate-binding protein (PAAT family) n=1 Tax=Roseateles saccharophilus TaxID=304 RepID=A0A4R3UCS8_ROSSA|nr:transporter substrate-binding domain-containing protein [Roseateles saccharophilus]MDG0835604.1 transporter substrate-binding domain-containing protein [Roseateles saccharophilus]TCU85111.1 amino acid ABC transporter substrate-binding protein (PAAT family) [Roseateles saccharophilus]
MTARGFPSALIGLACLLGAARAAAVPMLACADQAEIPPFTFAERHDGVASEQVIGASVDLLKEIGREQGWDIGVQLLPWARCLQDAANNRFQFVINLGRQEARSGQLLLSEPYFRMHSVYLYSRRLHPKGLELKSLADVHGYRVCGLSGYRFEAFGLNTADVDRGTTRSYEQLTAKLHLGRCDLVIDSRETIAGMYLINPKLRHLLVDGSLGMAALPGAPLRELYFGMPAAAPQAQALLKALNEGLRQKKTAQRIERLVDHYLD